MQNSDEKYNFPEKEADMQTLWSKGGVRPDVTGQTTEKFTIFLVPPNASGVLHVGNALMIALQDIQARFNRATGKNVLWVPSLDHGGYETQVTYERERESHGLQQTREEIPSEKLYLEINDFVEDNKNAIIDQIKSLGASLDWDKLRYTLDNESVREQTKCFVIWYMTV